MALRDLSRQLTELGSQLLQMKGDPVECLQALCQVLQPAHIYCEDIAAPYEEDHILRLQEANLGLAAIAEIQAAIVELRDYQPVIGVVAGSVGCFGGMSIAAGLCSYLLVTREARLGLNGPQVIEQEAGLDEYDSRDRPFIWSLTGGEQRYASGLVDGYVSDDVDAIRRKLHGLFAQGRPAQERSRRHAWFLQRLRAVDTTVQADAAAVRSAYQGA